MKARITELKQNEKNFFFKVEGDSRSFSGYGQSEYGLGDLVEFDVVTKQVGDKTYHNAKFVEKQEELTNENIDEIASLHVQMWIAVELAVAKASIQLTDQQKTAIYIQSCNSMKEARA